MKVYVVTEGDYSAYRIVAVTLDKNKADRIKKLYTSYSKVLGGFDNDARVEVYDTETADGIYDKGVLYCVAMDDKFHVRSAFVSENNDEKREDDCESVFESKMSRNEGKTYLVYVYAQDCDKAMKIAADRMAKYRAEKMGL